jgi:tryptophan-rich sensory protein
VIPTTPFYQALLGGVLFCTALGIAGGVLTKLSPWYYALRQPKWKPPDWAFGPVWTSIFICLSFAIAYAWDAGTAAQRIAILCAVGINGALNMTWSALFFTLHQPKLAFIELIFFWFSIVGLLVVLGGISGTALILLLPYILWVTTAGVLNFQIVRLNP